MNTKTKTLIAAFAMLFGADAALAQAMGGGGPAPGSADSKAVARGNQEVNAEYNRQIGAKDRKGGRRRGPVAATVEDLVAGTIVHGNAGVTLGTIDSLDVTGVIVAAPGGKVKVPVDAFGKDKNGLLIQMGKTEFDAAVAAANASPNG
ncbi:hypothetical protein E2493_06885 [Sphingomonas parva]|uniref:PRC-barrel domain containing protein n=1 Tax=Sphingomonas parva TaxID=2555898 RepID=A0A4Y8ZSJ1_9SPHN|nr:hypothetical protein [Sphingomonas parva]TFI58973.1 hypothetical protein E2493_06885 [Sphingomonas parva]